MLEAFYEVRYLVHTYHCFIFSTTLSRKEFNLDFGRMNSLIGDEIEVEMTLVAIQK